MATRTTTGGEQLKRVRLDAGLSQTALHEASGLSQPYISEIEHGSKPLSVWAATCVELALDLEARSLVRYAEDVPTTLASLLPGYLSWGPHGVAALDPFRTTTGTSPAVPSSAAA